MDTNINSESMNKNELHSLVRKAINEVLNEGPTEDETARIAAQQAQTSKLKALNRKKTELSTPVRPEEKPARDAEKTAVEKNIIQTNKELNRLKKPGLGVLDLDEMANVAATYELVPNINPEDYSGKKRRIINAMLEAGGPMSKPAVAAVLGYEKQNPVNADFMELVAQGAIVPTTEQAAPRFNRPVEPELEPEPEGEVDIFADEEPGQRELEDEIGDEAGVEGEEDDYKRYDPEFDVPEVEPEVGELEPATPITGGMSEEDYQAWIKYDELKQRLAATKSNISKAKRSRKGGIDDLGYSMDNEINRLIKLKNSLQTRIDDLVNSSPYLQSKTSQETEPAPPPPSIEDLIDDEEQLDEWVVNKWKYYAGIKK